MTKELPLLVKDSRELSVLVESALKAGDIMRQGYGHLQNIERKGYGDLVSEVDRNCDRSFQESFRAAFPDVPILSEEISPDTPHEVARLLILDPLDGTSAYLYGVSSSIPSVMAAIRSNGQIIYSVVYFPLTEELFYAIRGKGAYKESERLYCSDSELSNSWVEMNQYSNCIYESEVFKKLRKTLRSSLGAQLVTSLPANSGLGLRIAEGIIGKQKISAIVHDNGSKMLKQGPWDVAPIALIVEEAGGVVVNFEGQPYDIFAPEPFIVAASMKLAKEIIGCAK
jgi:myo-inositol-1(or 4)-monophosphatase